MVVTEPVDFKKIVGDKRVCFFSEDHTSMDDKKAFRQALTQLKELGFTGVVLEMLPRGFPTEDSSAVEEYFKHNWDKDRGMGKEYFAIYSRAKELDMHVWGGNIPGDEYQAAPDLSVVFDKTNRAYVDEIESHLQEDLSARVVGLNGRGHAGYFFSRGRANGMLSDEGFDSVVVGCFGGDQRDLHLSGEEEGIYRATKRRMDQFMVQVSAQRRSVDYMIFHAGERDELI